MNIHKQSISNSTQTCIKRQGFKTPWS